MKARNFGTVLLVIGMGLLGWAAYDYFAHTDFNASNCGVTVAPVSTPVAVTAFAENRIPLELINGSGRPVRIVGNNACWGLACDFGSKSMPVMIENGEYEFDLLVRTLASGKQGAEFNLFLEVKNVLVIYPVRFGIEVLNAEGSSTDLTEAADVDLHEPPPTAPSESNNR